MFGTPELSCLKPATVQHYLIGFWRLRDESVWYWSRGEPTRCTPRFCGPKTYAAMIAICPEPSIATERYPRFTRSIVSWKRECHAQMYYYYYYKTIRFRTGLFECRSYGALHGSLAQSFYIEHRRTSSIIFGSEIRVRMIWTRESRTHCGGATITGKPYACMQSGRTYGVRWKSGPYDVYDERIVLFERRMEERETKIDKTALLLRRPIAVVELF